MEGTTTDPVGCQDGVEEARQKLAARKRLAGETREQWTCAIVELAARCNFGPAMDTVVQMLVLTEFPGEERERARKASTPVQDATKLRPATLPTRSVSDSGYSLLPLSRYKKTGGAADGAGNDYEWKMLTLVFLRMLAAGHEFQLASNMEAAGLFDDIVARYRKHPDDELIVAYLQLKHKAKKSIPKPSFIGLSGDFSLVKYCVSYEAQVAVDLKLNSVNKPRYIIFTNASINDELVNELEEDKLFATGGKVVSFKADGYIYKGLCEWVDFKDALTDLHSQVDGLSDEATADKIRSVLQSSGYGNIAIVTFRDDIMKSPTKLKLKEVLAKLKSVSDKDTYSSFLADLQIYTNQTHESELDAKIKEELSNVWQSSVPTDSAIMFHELQEGIKSWWQKENFYLTETSPLWLGIVKSQIDNLSTSTIEGLTKSGFNFEENCLQILQNKIDKIITDGGILNLRVDSRTTASSLKAYQALYKFCPDSTVLHVNMKALLEREDDVLSAWASRWCQLLVVECDDELDLTQAVRLSARILELADEKKLLVLIASEGHELNVQLHTAKCYAPFNDNSEWCDLTEDTRQSILDTCVVINGSRSEVCLSNLLGGDKGFANKANLDVISQMLREEFCFGMDLNEKSKYFVTRRLKESTDGVPFVINSLGEVNRKVALLVAEPGMGKSTLITHLANSAKDEDPTAWIVNINLNDCTQYLQDIDVDNFNQFAARKFLEQAAIRPGNSLEKLFLGALEHKLVLFVDGVDEVCPHYEQQVFTLLKYLKDMEFSRLWVASRPVFQTKLEITLDVSHLRLVAFSEEDRKDFFNKMWAENVPSASQEKCNEVTESLLTWLTDSLGKDHHILGVPLMTAMIAEIFQERMFSKTGDNNQFEPKERLDLISLYRSFVKKKVDFYCVEKKKMPSRKLAANIVDEEILLNQMHYYHRLAALRTLFSREEVASLQFEGMEKFDEDLTYYLNEVSNGREKLGIIDNVVDGVPHFVHRSFAEYFAATWLVMYFKNNKSFIERILFDPAYKLISDMFNLSLAENHPIHVAVRNRNLDAMNCLLEKKSPGCVVNALDGGGRTPLLLAVLLSGTDRHPEYINIIECLINKHKASLDLVDEVLGWSPLRYAEFSGALASLQILLEKIGKVGMGKLSLIQKQESWPKPDPRLMLDAARDSTVLVVRYLVEERGGKLNCRGPHFETMIHRAAEGRNLETLKYLRKKGHSVRFLLKGALELEAVNLQGLTALQEAAQHGSYEVMALLLEAKALYSISSSAKASQIQLNASLLCAAFSGNLESVKKLLKLQASDAHRDNNGHTPAWVAMHRKHIDVMNWLLLLHGADGDTPLHGACSKGDSEIVTFILSRKGADIEAKGYRKRTPLILAAESGQLGVMELLLERGASVDCQDEDGNTPLHKASWGGYEQAVELLLRHGANITCENKKGWTPLHSVSWFGVTTLMELLLEKGACVDAGDVDGNTPLHNASRRGHKAAVELLLRHGANITSCENVNGESLLHVAALAGKTEVMELLFEKGVNVESRDLAGNTPLHSASLRGHKASVVLLLNQGANIDVQNDKGETPIHSASWRGQTDMMTLLFEMGTSVECRDNDGNTPLHNVAHRGHKQGVEMLLRHGASVNSENYKGETPLHVATWRAQTGTLKLLLEKGAGVACRDNDGNTPLHNSSRRGSKHAVELLLRHGANELAVNNENASPLSVATREGRTEVVRALESRGRKA